jgi:propionate CoA-transferase
LFNKITDAANSLSCVADNSVVAISGFNLAANPEYLILELYKKYKKQGHPKNLFIISEALPAIPGRALDKVAGELHKDPRQSFLQGALLPFLGFSPWLQRLVTDNRIEVYSWPVGIVAYWFREIASGRPGLLTKIGIDTYLDPRREGGFLNERARQKQTCKVSVINLENEEYLLYHAPKPDFALIRATTSDETGNLSMEDEAIKGTILNIAQAARARPKPGVVIGQVRWLTRSGTINPRSVDVPGPLVDHVVVAPKQYHWQSGSHEYDPRSSFRVIPSIDEMSLGDILAKPESGYQRIIARRVLLELIKILEEKGSPVLINLGIGIPAIISQVAAEENLSDLIVTVLESGQWGGIALSGIDFGVAISPFALSTMPDMFSNFEGGIIDGASLGFLQVDAKGNVNPSMLPGRVYGPGGFPDIAGGAPRIYFAGAFTSGASKIKTSSNGLHIHSDGEGSKFVPEVFKIFFSGSQALKNGKEVLYVTERAVFRLMKRGLVLEETAPGVDLERDILGKMRFAPIMPRRMKTMEKALFKSEKMNLRADIMTSIKS